MPCNSEYMNPSFDEIRLSVVLSLIDELKTGELNKHHYRGYHPKVYNKSVPPNLDKSVAKLCKLCKQFDVSDYSLELQMWWRDHQEADKQREEREAQPYPVTVADLIKFLKSQPQDLPVAYCRYSEQCLLELTDIKLEWLSASREDGWVHDKRDDKPAQLYLVLPGN